MNIIKLKQTFLNYYITAVMLLVLSGLLASRNLSRPFAAHESVKDRVHQLVASNN